MAAPEARALAVHDGDEKTCAACCRVILVSEVGGKKWVFSPAILQSPSLRFLSHWNFFLGPRDDPMHVLWWCATLIFCFFQPLIEHNWHG